MLKDKAFLIDLILRNELYLSQGVLMRVVKHMQEAARKDALAQSWKTSTGDIPCCKGGLSSSIRFDQNILGWSCVVLGNFLQH